MAVAQAMLLMAMSEGITVKPEQPFKLESHVTGSPRKMKRKKVGNHFVYYTPIPKQKNLMQSSEAGTALKSASIEPSGVAPDRLPGELTAKRGQPPAVSGENAETKEN